MVESVCSKEDNHSCGVNLITETDLWYIRMVTIIQLMSKEQREVLPLTAQGK